MTVAEFIEILKKCDSEALVKIRFFTVGEHHGEIAGKMGPVSKLKPEAILEKPEEKLIILDGCACLPHDEPKGSVLEIIRELERLGRRFMVLEDGLHCKSSGGEGITFYG